MSMSDAFVALRDAIPALAAEHGVQVTGLAFDLYDDKNHVSYSDGTVQQRLAALEDVAGPILEHWAETELGGDA